MKTTRNRMGRSIACGNITPNLNGKASLKSPKPSSGRKEKELLSIIKGLEEQLETHINMAAKLADQTRTFTTLQARYGELLNKITVMKADQERNRAMIGRLQEALKDRNVTMIQLATRLNVLRRMIQAAVPEVGINVKGLSAGNKQDSEHSDDYYAFDDNDKALMEYILSTV